MNNAVLLAEIIEKNLCTSAIYKINPDESDFIDYKMKYRSLQIPCLFQKDKKCAIYEVRPTCCVTYYSYGPYEDWIIEQISSFLDYNRRKIPKSFNPFNINLLPVSIRDNIVSFGN